MNDDEARRIINDFLDEGARLQAAAQDDPSAENIARLEAYVERQRQIIALAETYSPN